MELTDRHFRYLIRRLTRCSVLYTEMVTTGAVLNGDKEYLLGKDQGDNPVVLQLGGSDPVELAEAASVGEEWGYDAINLNVGCPSDRVKSGRFGACLMAEPDLVGDCVQAMQRSVKIPVTVKCRLGIDRDDSYEALRLFVDQVASKGCQQFIVHARKAWLDGLSPKENRTIPPLRYEYVYRLKKEFPSLHIGINGGITTLADTQLHLQQVDSVMIGREAYYNPSCLLSADHVVYGQSNPHNKQADQAANTSYNSSATRTADCSANSSANCSANTSAEYSTKNSADCSAENPAKCSGVCSAKYSSDSSADYSAKCSDEIMAVLAIVAKDYAAYMQNQYECGVRINAMSRHLIALYQGVPGARLWRRHLSEQASNATNAEELVDQALEYVLNAPKASKEPRYAS